MDASSVQNVVPKKLHRYKTRGNSVHPAKIIIYILLALWALTTVFPFIWVIINSFKQNSYIISKSFEIPTSKMFTWENYQTAFSRINIVTAYKNSLLITATVTVVAVILAGFAAYGLARYEFKGKQLLYSLVIASMMFPAFSTIIPVFTMEFDWHIVNTYSSLLSSLSVILPQIAGSLSFAIIVLLGFIRSLPVDLEEAAYLEGYNVFQIFFKVVLFLIKPSLATVAIFTFLWSYNDLFTQMFFLRYQNSYTITVLLNEIQSIAGTNYGMMFSSVVLVVIPVLIVYIVLQKNIIKGLTAGALKG